MSRRPPGSAGPGGRERRGRTPPRAGCRTVRAPCGCRRWRPDRAPRRPPHLRSPGTGRRRGSRRCRPPRPRSSRRHRNHRPRPPAARRIRAGPRPPSTSRARTDSTTNVTTTGRRHCDHAANSGAISTGRASGPRTDRLPRRDLAGRGPGRLPDDHIVRLRRGDPVRDSARQAVPDLPAADLGPRRPAPAPCRVRLLAAQARRAARGRTGPSDRYLRDRRGHADGRRHRPRGHVHRPGGHRQGGQRPHPPVRAGGRRTSSATRCSSPPPASPSRGI